MSVDVFRKLAVYLLGDFAEVLLLFVRKVQGFAGLIVEKGIRLDVFAERSATDKIGVKEKSPTSYLFALGVGFGKGDDLSRSDAHQASVLKVVGLLSVFQLIDATVFEQHGIKPHREPCPLRERLVVIGKIYQRHQRVLYAFARQHSVHLGNGFYVFYFVHFV